VIPQKILSIYHNQQIRLVFQKLLICTLIYLGSTFTPIAPAYSLVADTNESDVGTEQESTDVNTTPVNTTPDIDDEEKNPDIPEIEGEAKIHVGGALRFNAFYKSWDEANNDKSGDFIFEVFRIDADGSFQDLDISLDYRFYSGMNMLRYGYVGHTFDNGTEVQVGVSRKPFGLLPYAGNSWFFDLTYYLGMEDDADAGIKIIKSTGNFDIQLAFYKNDEGSYTGQSIDSARYSYDVSHTDSSEIAGLVGGPRTNKEINQFNGRVAYKIANTEIGVSGEYGGLYNATTRDIGDHWATAVHLNGNYGRFNVTAEALAFAHSPKNPVGQDNRFVVIGAFDAPYKMAAEGSVFLANIAYKLPIDGKVLDSITFYNDFSYLKKKTPGFADSQQNVAGMLFAAGGLFTYVDFAFGKNHPWIGPNYQFALAEGDPNAGWELRFNINLGFYF
jgi:hypothetical protein